MSTAPRGASSITSAAGEELCGACGLCCDGTFFVIVRLTIDDQRRLRGRRLPVVTESDGAHLQQPCAAHEGPRCAIYGDRPRNCAGYRCRQLVRLDAGETTLPEALIRVEAVKALAQSIRQALPRETMSQALFTAAEALFDDEDARDAEWSRTHAGTLMDMATFLRLSRRDFGIREGGEVPAAQDEATSTSPRD